MMFPNLRRIFNILSQLCSRSAASAVVMMKVKMNTDILLQERKRANQA